MSRLEIRPSDQCRWAEASFGEVMLRLDPGDMRIRTTREFRVWEGGGEYNVARGLRKCFGLPTTVATALPENDLGELVKDLIMQGGVDMSYIMPVAFDGIGRETRVGLNFTERGFGARGALGVSDRGHSAASQIKPGDIDWKRLFVDEGVRWFHSGGIFAALSPTTSEALKEAFRFARENGVVVSYDLNFRPSLWKSMGGSEAAIRVNRELVEYVDVLFGNEEDFTNALGFKVPDTDSRYSDLDPAKFMSMMEDVTAQYPHLKAVATTLRAATSASRNDWSAVLYYDRAFFQGRKFESLEIYDRVGGGDSFASGLIYGLLTGKTPQECVEYGVAHGALAMTTPGDTSMASLKEVEKLVGGGSARVDR